jgi:hypothetical protein
MYKKEHSMKVYSLAILCIFSVSRAFSLSPTDEEFITRYAVDPSLAEILDQHSQEIAQKLEETYKKPTKKHGVWTFEWLPGYYVKYNLARIKGMERMRECIQKNNLTFIRVPDKRIYHIKGKPRSLHNLHYAIVVKASEADPLEMSKPLTLDQVKQLCVLIEKTGYISMTNTNYIRGSNGILTMIDSEATFDHSQRILAYIRMIGARHNLNRDYTPEALTLILNEMANTLKKLPPKDRETALSTIYRYLHEQQKPHRWDYIGYFASLHGAKPF